MDIHMFDALCDAIDATMREGKGIMSRTKFHNHLIRAGLSIIRTPKVDEDA